jgi:site-specific DNA recombinase
MSKQAAIYARVSTDDQAERGYSLPSQIEACRQFAASKGLEIAAVHADDISGAMPFCDRPEGEQLQDAINTRLIGAVIVYQVDRLSRDIVDLLTTVRDWIRAGIEIYALDIGQVKSELDIMLVIRGWQGSDERLKIRERTNRGKIAKARAGRVVGTGLAPYGYTYANGELCIDESQARIVQMIFDWYANGDERGQIMSLYKIAARLTDMGIPSPSVVKRSAGNQVRTGGWSTGLIQRFITSETYAGVWRYGKQSGKEGRGGRRPVDEQISVHVPAIVDRETWDLAQKRREYNSKFAKRRMTREYLLCGLIYCGCGRAMVGGGGDAKRYYYYCPRRNPKYGGAIEKATCTEPLVRSRPVEYIAWGYIMRLLTNADEFEQALRDAQAHEAEQMQPKQNELQHVIALMAATEYEAVQVAQTASKFKGIVGEKLQVQADEINRRYQALEKRKAELEKDLQHELTDSHIDTLIEFREAVAVGLNHLKPEERRAWLEVLQTRVTVSNGIATVTCRLGGAGASFDLFTQYETSHNL